MERDKPNGIAGRKFIISTHTLTWSVTVTPSYVAVTSAISTHTLTWSVTSKKLITEYFALISTHTLTWSVTIPLSAWNDIFKFQLTRSRGA